MDRGRDRIILALDTSKMSEAEKIMSDLSQYVGPVKIGLEAINAFIARGLAEMVMKKGGLVFWDGKLKDIPNTVSGASKALVESLPGLWAFNVHADGGVDMMRAAVQSCGSSLVLAVTALTSLDEEDVQDLHGCSVKAKVLRDARNAYVSGVSGLICSPQEAQMLRKRSELGGLLLVTPGIRPDWAVPQDQKRPTTPKQAIMNGADFIVVGRPITEPPGGRSRIEAAELIAQEIEEAFEERGNR